MIQGAIMGHSGYDKCNDSLVNALTFREKIKREKKERRISMCIILHEIEFL